MAHISKTLFDYFDITIADIVWLSRSTPTGTFHNIPNIANVGDAIKQSELVNVPAMLHHATLQSWRELLHRASTIPLGDELHIADGFAFRGDTVITWQLDLVDRRKLVFETGWHVASASGALRIKRNDIASVHGYSTTATPNQHGKNVYQVSYDMAQRLSKDITHYHTFKEMQP